MGKLRDFLRRRSGTVALVLSGGGNHGAVQVGMLRALVEHEIRADLVLGCSIGALNGAAFAEDPTLRGVARLEALWGGLDTEEIMPTGWLPNAVALARRGEAIGGNDKLRGIVTGLVRASTFEELQLAFQCVATDVDGVREAWFSTGPIVEPILASAALPAVLPAVEIDGVRYLDGAIVNDVPITRAVELGATHDLRAALRHDRSAPPGAQAAARRPGAGVLGRPPSPVQARPGVAPRGRRGHRAAGR